MTPEEFLEAMKELAEFDPYGYLKDAERTHADADDLLCHVLHELGYGEGVDFFKTLDLWYA